MHFKILKLFTLPICFAAMGCVSVGLQKTPIVKSDKYTFQNPNSAFKKVDPDNADYAWRNPKTGNTIAVISECSATKDPELGALESESIQALSSPKILSSKESTFNDREALRSVAEGTIDGVAVKIDVLNFKKSTCVYSLTYFGRLKSFGLDQVEFENFLKGFTAQ
jgi:hypothetical protein